MIYWVLLSVKGQTQVVPCTRRFFLCSIGPKWTFSFDQPLLFNQNSPARPAAPSLPSRPSLPGGPGGPAGPGSPASPRRPGRPASPW